MKLNLLKKTRFAILALAVVAFSACAEKKQQTATTDPEAAHEQEAQTPPASQEIVKAPDYKAAGTPVKGPLSQLLTSYLKVTDALVASDLAATKQAAGAVTAAAGKVPVSALSGEQKDFAEEKLDEIKQSADKIAGAKDIEAARQNLELLSEATFSLTKAFGASDQPLYYQHCPMANNNQGAYWLSASKEIRNPYFGKSMLNCGSTEEVLN